MILATRGLVARWLRLCSVQGSELYLAAEHGTTGAPPRLAP